ncbi:hypothetical protein DFH08DRAFT_960400 [Mycena albidolilacea]|uniref:Myb/SANT-like domain-containing protein n=1 Tax=Mycena albidolilacea TaxID=1033008 RepID=A0AAD7A238_9AGAR|nr:hypothetical protein DFH08DRAFT_960400 [Mycena albidolilacea]
MGKNKENKAPDGTGPKRAPWRTTSDAKPIGQLSAEKAAGNQTNNAGWHQAAWTACGKALEGSEKGDGGGIKAQYVLVKMLRGKSGWGWNKELKQIVVSDNVWDAYLLINPKICPWHNKGFPLYQEMADLVDGGVATGERAFLPGQGPVCPTSPDWPEDLVQKDDDFPLDPVLRGAGGRVDPPPQGAPPVPSSPSPNSDMDDLVPTPSQTPAPRNHGRKPSNGHALMAVSQSLEGIAAALAAESSGPSEVQRKTAAIKVISTLPDFTRQEKSRIFCLIRADTGIADALMAIPDDKPEDRIDYLRTELTLA